MKTKTTVPTISLTIAEKTIRDIAKREGEAIKKRRSKTMIDHFGPGYMIYDPMRNIVLGGATGGSGQDGCGFDLEDLADWYADCEANTAWQNIVLTAVKKGKVAK